MAEDKVVQDETDESAAPEKHRHLEVEITNEDDGDVYKFSVKHDERLDSVIARLYADKLHREPVDDDRLRCEAGGEDVFTFASMTFKAYLDAGHCAALKWLFSGPTGGA